MNFIKKIIFSFFGILFLLLPNLSLAQQYELDVYFFYSYTCPHCTKEHMFLKETLEPKYEDYINVHYLEVSKDRENSQLFSQMARELGKDSSAVPFTIIGDEYIAGYYNDQVTGSQIENIILSKLGLSLEEFQEQEDSKKMILPVLGKINPETFSLPLISIVLGVLDGFNPCAMWALLFLISLLLGMEDRRRMWIFGITFIVSSAVVYFIFMAAWLNLILFLGFVTWIRLLIGLVALLGGGLHLRSWHKNKDGGCEVGDPQEKKKIFEKLKQATQQKNFWAALLGIIVLAFAVNLVELVCSAGLPAVFTQILTLNNLSTWQYYGYILLYIFFFMLDDLLVFVIAMVTLKMTGLSTKYSRWSNLIGGILMIIIGIILIFKPEWLMFG